MNPKAVDIKIIREIAEETWNSHELNIDLGDQCERLLKEHLPHISDWEICEASEDIERKVKFHIRREIARCSEKGITPRYEFSEVSNVLYRARDIRIDEIKSEVRNINWRSFEDLCKYLLEVNGIEGVQIKKRSKEGGIDFCGLLRMHKFTQRILLEGLEMRVIGQARHRSTDKKVGEPEIKLFAKQYYDFRSGKGRGQKAVPEWFRKLKSPVVGTFITNAECTKDAYTAAKEEGIILKGGDEIAEDLAHSPELAKWLSAERLA